jgi:NAD(P)-dependent dehydrogenase (short-subunit alcohol dehydrogenase family)
MAVNVDGRFHVAQEAARRMIRDGNGGSIINISSILSEIPIRQVAAYSTSKAAVSQMTRCSGAGMGKAPDPRQRDPSGLVRNQSDWIPF